jgi:hypothetical protein
MEPLTLTRTLKALENVGNGPLACSIVALPSEHVSTSPERSAPRRNPDLSPGCMAYWCPCVLFGRTYARDHGDPDSSGMNSSVCLSEFFARLFYARPMRSANLCSAVLGTPCRALVLSASTSV